jgi:hypothetical protein
LQGGDDYPVLAHWNQTHESRTVEIVSCSAGRPTNRQTYYGASPRALRITASGIELDLAYASSVASPVAANASLCSSSTKSAVTLFDRRFGRAWTVRTSHGDDLWRYQSRNGRAAAFFRDRENTTVSVELAEGAYIVDYLGCEYRGVADGDNVVLQPTGRSPGTCSGNVGEITATIVR